MKTEVKLISAVSSKRTLVQRKKSNQKFIKHLGTINKMQPKVYNKIVFKENTFRRSSKIERNILSKNNNNNKKKRSVEKVIYLCRRIVFVGSIFCC